jgi:hypothetical protein
VAQASACGAESHLGFSLTWMNGSNSSGSFRKSAQQRPPLRLGKGIVRLKGLVINILSSFEQERTVRPVRFAKTKQGPAIVAQSACGAESQLGFSSAWINGSRSSGSFRKSAQSRPPLRLGKEIVRLKGLVINALSSFEQERTFRPVRFAKTKQGGPRGPNARGLAPGGQREVSVAQAVKAC